MRQRGTSFLSLIAVMGLGAALLSMAACSSGGQLITLSSEEPSSQIELVPLTNPEGSGVKLKNPVTVAASRLQGKALRISAVGKAPEYWFAPVDGGRRVGIRVKKLQTCDNAPSSETNRNRPVRLLMKAYQALTAEDFHLAHALAQKTSEVDSTLAAPYIISGLAYYHEGKKEEARVAFNKAKALDPEDTGIQELLRLVE